MVTAAVRATAAVIWAMSGNRARTGNQGGQTKDSNRERERGAVVSEISGTGASYTKPERSNVQPGERLARRPVSIQISEVPVFLQLRGIRGVQTSLLAV